MDRGKFLKRVGLAIGGLAVGRNIELPAAPAAPAGVVEVGVIRDSVLTTVNDYQLFRETLTASGGLCAPLTPIYDMPAFTTHPIREALPTFTASRS